MDKVSFSKLSAAIKASNAQWIPRRSSFDALTKAEKVRRLGVVVDKTNLAAIMARPPTASVTAAVRAPSAIDWRTQNGRSYVSAVKDQGNCGSCVSFGVTACIEAKTIIQFSQTLDLSEADLHFCSSHGSNCGGWWPTAALDWVKQHGVTDEPYFPYSTAGVPNPSCRGAADRNTRTVRIDDYTMLTSMADRKAWISVNGPVVAIMRVYEDFYSVGTGVYSHVIGSMFGHHCVAVVGYDDVAKCWICKNSWGQEWGDKGYFRIAYGSSGIDETNTEANAEGGIDRFPFWGIGKVSPTLSRQSNWRWCNKCQGLAYGGQAAGPGRCPAGGVHDHGGSGNYALQHNSRITIGQQNWRWCNKCQGLAFGGSTGGPGVCPAGGSHDHTGSGNYALQHNLNEAMSAAEGQTNWRWCRKCQGLAYAGNATGSGPCPAGGKHDHLGSGNYTLKQA